LEGAAVPALEVTAIKGDDDDDAPPEDRSALERDPNIDEDMSVTSETSNEARFECFSNVGVHLLNPAGRGIQGFVALANSSNAAVGGGDIGENVGDEKKEA